MDKRIKYSDPLIPLILQSGGLESGNLIFA